MTKSKRDQSLTKSTPAAAVRRNGSLNDRWEARSGPSRVTPTHRLGLLASNAGSTYAPSRAQGCCCGVQSQPCTHGAHAPTAWHSSARGTCEMRCCGCERGDNDPFNARVGVLRRGLGCATFQIEFLGQLSCASPGATCLRLRDGKQGEPAPPGAAYPSAFSCSAASSASMAATFAAAGRPVIRAT